MLSLILALVCAFVGSLFLFGGMMLTVPKKEDFEFKDRLRAYQASSTFGDVIESTDLACSFMSAALFIADTYLPNEPTWMSTLELAFAIFFAVNFFFCLYIAANKIKYLRSLQAAVDLITVFPMLLLFIFTGDPSGAGLSSASGVLNGADRRYALVCPDGERLVEPSDLLFVLIHSRDKYDELSAYRGPDPTSPMTPVPSGDPNPGGSS